MLEPAVLLPLHCDLYVLIKTKHPLSSFQFIHSFIHPFIHSFSQSANSSDSCFPAVPHNGQHETATRIWNYKIRLSYFCRGVSIYYALFRTHGEFYCFRLPCCLRETRAQLALPFPFTVSVNYAVLFFAEQINVAVWSRLEFLSSCLSIFLPDDGNRASYRNLPYIFEFCSTDEGQNLGIQGVSVKRDSVLQCSGYERVCGFCEWVPRSVEHPILLQEISNKILQN